MGKKKKKHQQVAAFTSDSVLSSDGSNGRSKLNSKGISGDCGGAEPQHTKPPIATPQSLYASPRLPSGAKPFYLPDGVTVIGYREVAATSPEVQLVRDDRLLRLPLLPPSECRKLLELAKTFDDWDALSDSVDRKSENQHTIFDLAKGTDDGVLHPFCAHVSAVVLEPVLKKFMGLASLHLHWAFIRRYTMDGRLQFPVHRDSSAATVNILLSDPQDFAGAELYLLSNDHKNADSMSDKEFKKVLPEPYIRQKFAVPYVQGECCMHQGKRLHGVLPLSSGERFTLILMYLP